MAESESVIKYADGTEPRVGDLVIGYTPKRGPDVVGFVQAIDHSWETSNLALVVMRQTDPEGLTRESLLAFVSHISRTPLFLSATVESGSACDFKLLHRAEMTRIASAIY